MAYATVTDAIELYGEAAIIVACDRDGAGALDTASFERHLRAASDVIDAHLMGRYDLPLSSAPSILIKYCVDIARANSSADVGTITTRLLDLQKEAMEYLGKVAEGKYRLVKDGDKVTGGNISNTPEIVTAKIQKDEMDCGSRYFTRSKMRDL
jgi:phage gp36-like protein